MTTVRLFPWKHREMAADAAACVLPFIEQTKGAVVKSEGKPSPHAITSECLPQDVLQSLRRQSGGSSPPVGGTRLPPPQGRHAQHVSRPPDNVWNHPARRNKMKHLTDNTLCICGAGKGISFLYDSGLVPSLSEQSGAKAAGESLIPDDFHVVKHPGVLGLEFHDEPFATHSGQHDSHMTIFPSMRPSGRQEAVALKHTLEQMLERAGIPYEITDTDLKGPTEMHNLLELVRKEQAIYNVCFHELIRQVSVHCVERGQLLADLRRRYSNLLDRIPRQIKSLHDEGVAQRTLDKRLTTELKSFKERISSLTEELCAVREHDLSITEQSQTAQENLATALAESEKNASILAEYHELYELQRKRLEEQVGSLTLEKEVWQQAAYGLAYRVSDAYSLQTIHRLQLGERAWSKLAGHFAVLLSDRDTQQLSEVQGYVQTWREKVMGVARTLELREANMNIRLQSVEAGLKQWSQELTSVVGPDGVVHVPGPIRLKQLWQQIRAWQECINKEAENFTGDLLLSRQEELAGIAGLVQQWTDVSLRLFSRHQESDEAAHCPEHADMLQLNTAIDSCLVQYGVRLAGENGVATGFIHLATPLETWDTKLHLVLSSSEAKLPDSDWIKLATLLKEWGEQVHSIAECIGSVDEGGCPPLGELVGSLEKWRSALSYSMDSLDTQTVEQVSSLHSSLVQWMAQLLLASTATVLQPSEEEGSGHPQHITSVSRSELRAGLGALSQAVAAFTKQLTRNCLDIVRDIFDERQREGYPNPEEEQAELRRLGEEEGKWSELATLLLDQLSQGDTTATAGDGDSKEKESSEGGGGEEELKGDSAMSVLGPDENLHAKTLSQASDETPAGPAATRTELGLHTEDRIPEGRGVQDRDAETVVIALDQAEEKIKSQEQMIVGLEERAVVAEEELQQARARVAGLEQEVEQLKASLEQKGGPSGRSSRASSKAATGGGRKPPSRPTASRQDNRRISKI